jgi:uncharacterized membrane protein
MKKHFVTGLIILLPLALTLIVVSIIFNFLTTPFIGIIKRFMEEFNLFSHGFLFLSEEQVQTGIGKLFVFISLILFTIMLGALARWFFFHYLLKFWDDYILHRIPFISSIYKTSQDVIKTIFISKEKSFKQVVLAPFPNRETLSIGLVTCENLSGLPRKENEAIVAVFVPTTPNPTSGFLTVFNSKDLVYLDMSVEDAFKYVISCGVIAPPFKATTPAAAREKVERDD